MTVRTRFAPSPTGFLHIGGARTALFSWLFAKKHQGQFILRIEDTDQERSTQASVDAILHGMAWLGLDHDEGPFYQMQRLDRYRAVAQQLLEEGNAYRCFCSKERLETLREAQTANKEKPRYDGHCRAANLPHSDAPHVIRFKNPSTGAVTFHDEVYGDIEVQNNELDDVVLIRSDGIPTYNFSVVVDDIDMNITHVIRGDDHINNTPRQINIYKALQKTSPIYCHLPMILGEDGKRLSKRHGAASVLDYREEGYLPKAVLNYLVRLGWSHGDQEIFSIDEMIQAFDTKHISRSAAALNPEKLKWLNQHYLKTSDPETFLPELYWHLDKAGFDRSKCKDYPALIRALAERVHTLKEMVSKSEWLFNDTISYDAEAQKHFIPEVVPAFTHLVEAFKTIEWTKESIHLALQAAAEATQLKLGKIAQPLRVALTGGTVSPPIDITAYLISRERVVARIEKALSRI